MTSKANTKAKRGARKATGKRGMGRLYKRSGGRDYPPDSPVSAPYWLQYTIPNPDGGRGAVKRMALKDEHDNAITDREQAETERALIVAPFAARDAVEAQRQILSRLQTAEQRVDDADDAAHPPLKISDAWRAYRDSERRPDSGSGTLEGYEGQWAKFADWAKEQGVEYMRDLSRENVTAYASHLNKELSAGSFNQHTDTLKRFYDVLSDEARVTNNPWARVRKRTVDKIERRKRALTLDEAGKVVEAAETEDMRDLLILIACTGQRLGDVCLMRWSSIDMDAGIIELAPGKTKRRKGETVFIPILPQARKVFESRRCKSGYVLPEIAARYKKDRSAPSKDVQATFKRAGFVTKRDNGKGRAIVELGAHSMRHCFVTMARWAGLPDALIQKITGHSSSRMIDHYTQFDRAMVARLSNGFAALDTGSGTLALPEGATAAHDEPLPPWAVELIKDATGRNWKKVQAELLERGAA